VNLDELSTLDVPTLVARYESVFGRPPRSKHRGWLVRRLAWRLQEEALGGLSGVAQRRLDELMAQIKIPTHVPVPRAKASISRVWNGKRIEARPVVGGYEFNGKHYKSLSALAKSVTGQHISGVRWFGLKESPK